MFLPSIFLSRQTGVRLMPWLSQRAKGFILHVVRIDRFLRRAGDVNALIDRMVAAEIKGLTSPARQLLPHSFPCEA